MPSASRASTWSRTRQRNLPPGSGRSRRSGRKSSAPAARRRTDYFLAGCGGGGGVLPAAAAGLADPAEALAGGAVREGAALGASVAGALRGIRLKLLMEIRWLYTHARSPERNRRRICASGNACSLRSSTIIRPAIEKVSPPARLTLAATST